MKGDNLIGTAEKHPELLNGVYGEICEEFGPEIAIRMYSIFNGESVTFPRRLLDPEQVHKCIIREFNGVNVRNLAMKYGYSEKSIVRIVREGK